ncbi:DUF2612 domain-containing protein [Streptomyces sp. G35A]
MAVNPFEETQYLDEARSRYTIQFEDQPVFDKYVQLLLSEFQEIQQQYKALMQERSLDTAVGAQLDLLGAIVGQDRMLVNVDIFEFFGFDAVPNSLGFGTLDDSSVGGIFYDANNPRFGNVELNDDLYRLLIKAKIVKNVTRATPEDIMRFANFVFNTEGSTIQDEGEAAFRLMVGRQLSAIERSLLTYVDKTSEYNSYLLPKPVGVRVSFGDFDYNNFFAFSEVPNAKGFGSFEEQYYDGTYTYSGELNYLPAMKEGVGGKFASLLMVE